ncbi:MAG: GNAT family N-acetyltransferase [Hyphomicrobiaceae bacterium]
MGEFTISHAESDGRGRYSARVDGFVGEAELTYMRRGPDLVVAHHTFAPPSMRGTGVALALVKQLIADARTQGFKILPTCSYIAVQAKRHPEWADVISQ